MTNIDLADLETVTGGFLTRQDFQNGGKHLAESATVGAGAAGGFALGGPGGAFAGATGAELINRTGAPGSFGSWLGGKVYDVTSTPPDLDHYGSGPYP